jgi:3-oxo-5-alpha-steroid 4-dehydrogenase 1
MGLGFFISGFFINKKSDNILIALRKEQDGYQIPQKGLFKYVSCPNHFGEIMEWIGFAIIAWNIAALSFAVWTICNLLPRALNHHAWYKETFENYPKNRKALIPYIL